MLLGMLAHANRHQTIMVNYIELNSHQLRTLNMLPLKHPKMLLGMLVHANGHQTIMVSYIELDPYQLSALSTLKCCQVSQLMHADTKS